jgi:hypothetical protein
MLRAAKWVVKAAAVTALAITSSVGLVVILAHVGAVQTRLLAMTTPLKSGGTFDGMDFAGQDFSEMYLVDSHFAKANLYRVNGQRANFEGVDFTEANLTEVVFKRTNCAASNFTMAQVRGVDFVMTDLTAARFDGVDLSQTTFHGSNLTGTQFDHVKAMNWNSSELVAELLRRAAGQDRAQMKVAGLVWALSATPKNWYIFLGETDERYLEWALNALAPYVREGDDAPAELRERASRIFGAKPAKPAM